MNLLFLPEIMESRKYIQINKKLEKSLSIKSKIIMKINLKIFSQYFIQINNKFIKYINHTMKPNQAWISNKFKKF